MPAGANVRKPSPCLPMTKLLWLFCAGCCLAPAQAPKQYTCPRASTPPRIDGRVDDAAWAQTRWTDWFVDIQGPAQPKPRFRTRAKMLWDDDYFYVAAELEEPHVWATLTEHDAVIFRDNVFLTAQSTLLKKFASIVQGGLSIACVDQLIGSRTELKPASFIV